MSPGSIFCEYIYGTFLLVESAMQVGIALAQTSLQLLNTAFDAILSWCKFVVDIACEAILNGIRVLQKKLVDLLWDGYKIDPKTGKQQSAFCNNLYKCNVFIEELTNTNSLICKTLIKLGVITNEQRMFMNEIINDYNNFMDTICNFGFTFNFGLSAIKKMLNFYKKQINNFIGMLERKKDNIRRMIQSYLNKLIDIGIFDMLAKLKKYFNCVLDTSDTCTSISSTRNFYTDSLAKMHIEDCGNGNYKLESATANKMMNVFDSRLNQFNNSKNQIQAAIDALISPSDVRAASKAFNLAKYVFPGGMSWTDIKNGNWKNNRMYHYFSVKCDQFVDAFIGKHHDSLPPDVSVEYIIGGMRIDDKKGIISMNVNGVTEDIDVNDPVSMEGYSNDMLGWTTPSEPIEYNIEGDDAADMPDAFLYNGEIISALRAAIRISVENDTTLRQHCQEKWSQVNDMIRESELVTEV